MAPIGNPDDRDVSYRVWVGTITTVVPATIAVALRLVGRYVSNVGYWWDDYTIALSLVFNWVMAILRWVQILHYGLGRHVNFLSDEEARSFLKSFIAVQIVYFANACLTRSSILLLYWRIFNVVRRFRWSLWVAGFLTAGYFIACTTVAIAGCTPVSYFWHKDQAGSCIDEKNFFRWNGVANACLDFLVLCLPFPMLWRIKANRRQKWILSGIFMLGGFVCLVSIVRVIAFRVHDGRDPTYTTIDTAAWSSIEQSVGIICACLPTLRPFFRRLYGTTPSESRDSNFNKGDGSSAQSPRPPSSRSRRSQGLGENNGTELGYSDIHQIVTLPTGPSTSGGDSSPNEEERPLADTRDVEKQAPDVR